MMIFTVPAIAVVVGLLVYGLSSHKQLGLIVFGCGLLVLVYLLAGHVVRVA